MTKFCAINLKNNHSNKKTKTKTKTCIPSNIKKEVTKHVNFKSNLDLLSQLNRIPKNLSNQVQRFFKPIMPNTWKNDTYTWLTTSNISNIMEKFQSVYSNFKYAGTTPSDVCSHSVSIRSVRPDKQRNRMGIIFNLDPHYKSGSHWVAAYAQIPSQKETKLKPMVVYMDSVGNPPERSEIIQYLISLAKSCALLSKCETCPIYTSNSIIQSKSGQCGMFSIYFLETMIKSKQGKPSDWHKQANRINDKTMEQKRFEYFIDI